MQDGQDAVKRWRPAHFALLTELMREWVHRHTGNLLTVALALGVLVAPACGSGESLSYEESMELLESAAQRTVAGAFTLEDTNISVVETDDSPGEYVSQVFSLNYAPERGVFGYQETFNPYAPSEKRRFITTSDGRQYGYIESDRCYSDNPSMIMHVRPGKIGPGEIGLIPPVMRQPANFISGIRVIERGSTLEILEFEGFSGGTISATIRDGLLVENVIYAEGDNYGRLVGAGFDGKIIAYKHLIRFYNIGVEQEFPVPEPICE